MSRDWEPEVCEEPLNTAVASGGLLSALASSAMPPAHLWVWPGQPPAQPSRQPLCAA